MFVSAAEAFLTRMLDLVPIYRAEGRAIAALDPLAPAPSAAELAAVACRRWIAGCIPAGAEAMAPVVAGLAADDSPAALAAFARDVAALARAIDDGSLATTAGYARATALAALQGRDADAGRAAADCLYSFGRSGTGDLVAEVRRLAAGTPVGE